MSTALALTDIAVAFGALRAVDGVSLTVPKGQRRAIIGPNGAGKTTLFNAITGVIPPTEGRIVFDGRDITRLPPHRRARLGVSRTFQITNLFPSLSVADNMVLAARGRSGRKFSILGRPDTDAPEAEAISAALLAARLTDRSDITVAALSYGEQRQLEIALALVTTPRMLLLDEPAAGLSGPEGDELGHLVRRLAHEIGLAVLLIEHDVRLVMATCDRVAVLDFGRLIALGTPAEVTADEAVVAAYLGTPA